MNAVTPAPRRFTSAEFGRIARSGGFGRVRAGSGACGWSCVDDDLGDKRAEYAETGLSEYWVADVKARTLYRHAAPVDSAFTCMETTPLAEGFASLTWPALRVAAGVVG